VIVQPPRQAFDATVGLGPSRRLGRNARQLAALAADNATDERGKGRQMLGQAAAGLARIPLFQGLMYGTIAPKVVTHRIHLLIRWIFQRGYTMRQPLLNVYIKMSYKSVRWRIFCYQRMKDMGRKTPILYLLFFVLAILGRVNDWEVLIIPLLVLVMLVL